MKDMELAFTPAWQLAEMIRTRAISPVELTEMFLRRIEKLDHNLNAYLTVAGDQAMESARQAESAVRTDNEIGPLHGIPIAIKDLNSTKGLKTTRGSLLFKDFVPTEDDITVARIRQAGAIILGKTNTPEFGHSGTTENLLGDACRNPWNPERTAGGSSGGAGAGLAAGLHPLAQGSDGGGSIRIPASMCGVFGIKPTQGRVPRAYSGPGGWGMFSQNGPMARTVRDAAILLQVMAGPDRDDPTCINSDPPDFSAMLDDGVKSLRFGLSVDLGSLPVDVEVKKAIEDAAKVFEGMGAIVEPVKVDFDHDHIRDVFSTIWLSDYAANYGQQILNDPDSITPLLLGFIEEAVTWPASKLALALRELEWHKARVDTLVQQYDLLLTPTLATTAFPVGQRPTSIAGQPVDQVWGFTPFTFPINMSGHTAASVPVQFSAQGMPIGMHIIGRRGDESTVLRASAAFEKARPWSDKVPEIA